MSAPGALDSDSNQSLNSLIIQNLLTPTRIGKLLKYLPMIGRSKNIYNRIWEHLKTTTLMKRIENGPRGAKMLIIGEYMPQPGQSPEKAIAIVEKALIEHALTEGYELLNK